MIDEAPTPKHYYAITNRDGSPTRSTSSTNSKTLSSNASTSFVGNNATGDTDDLANRQWAIWLFSATTVLLFADQNLMSPNLTAIAEEYGFDDEERDTKLGGHIALAFWILGAPAALIVGILADQVNRSRLFAWTVGIGEGLCFSLWKFLRIVKQYKWSHVISFALLYCRSLLYDILYNNLLGTLHMSSDNRSFYWWCLATYILRSW